MLRGEDLAWQRMTKPFEPSVAEVEQIRQEVAKTLLAEVFTASFFASALGQAKAYEKDNSSPVSDIYSILQPPEQRAKLFEFLKLMRPKMSDAHWKHLSERLRSDSRSQSMLALFEVTICGNLLAQLPNEKVELNVPTSDGKDADISVILEERPVHIEITSMGESDAMKERLPMRRKQKFSVWTADHSEVDGTRLLNRISQKSKEFIEAHPNVLAIQIFGVFDWTELARENFLKQTTKRIGLILPFGRIELMDKYLKEPDKSCALTETEKGMLVKLLNGDEFFPIGYI